MFSSGRNLLVALEHTERGSTVVARSGMVISKHVGRSDSSIHPQVLGGTSLLIRKEIWGNSFYFLSVT